MQRVKALLIWFWRIASHPSAHLSLGFLALGGFVCGVMSLATSGHVIKPLDGLEAHTEVHRGSVGLSCTRAMPDPKRRSRAILHDPINFNLGLDSKPRLVS